MPSQYTEHQFALFSYNTLKPKVKAKIKISAARIREAKEMNARGDFHGAALRLHEVVEALEAFESRLSNRAIP